MTRPLRQDDVDSWTDGARHQRVMLHTRWTQLGDVVAECGTSCREVVACCPGLARWRRTPRGGVGHHGIWGRADVHVIAGLRRSGAAQASYVPDEQIQSLRELARLRARLLADRQDYLRQQERRSNAVRARMRMVIAIYILLTPCRVDRGDPDEHRPT
jgi:hypothetical protein